MPLKATCIDENRTIHLVIALDHEDVRRIMAGGSLTLTVGAALSFSSQIQIILGDTDCSRSNVKTSPATPPPGQ